MAIVIYAMFRFIETIKNTSAPQDNQKVELEKSYLLKEHTAYGIKNGFTKEQVYEVIPKEDVKEIRLFLEGIPTPAMEISIDTKSVLILELVNNKVYRIRVLDPRFETSEGIHIGSTLKELEQAYQEIVYSSSKSSIYAIVRRIDMSFQLENINEVPLEWYKTHERGLLDDNAKIVKILIM